MKPTPEDTELASSEHRKDSGQRRQYVELMALSRVLFHSHIQEVLKHFQGAFSSFSDNLTSVKIITAFYHIKSDDIFEINSHNYGL